MMVSKKEYNNWQVANNKANTALTNNINNLHVTLNV